MKGKVFFADLYNSIKTLRRSRRVKLKKTHQINIVFQCRDIFTVKILGTI